MTAEGPGSPGDQPQQPGGQPPQQPGGYQPPPVAPGQVPPGQPGVQIKKTPTSATVALILGILGVTICTVCAPFAWWQGQVARNEIDNSGGALEGRGLATAGYVMGIIGSAILGLAIVVIIIVIAAGASSA